WIGRRRTTSSLPAQAPRRRASVARCVEDAAAPPCSLLLEGVGVLEVGEAREAAEEGEIHPSDRAVALLADDDLGAALRLLLVRRVHLFAVDEEDHVGVLLDRARFAQVRHHRAAVVAGLDRARELRE